MKTKLSIMNSPFTFRGSSCCNNVPKTVEWVHVDEIPESQPVVLFDECLRFIQLKETKNDRVYGWIGESSEVVYQVINDVVNNKQLYKDRLRKIFTHDERLLSEDPELFQYCPPASNLSWIVDRGIHQKTKLCSYITSLKNVTSGHKIRIQLLNHFKERGILDGHIYGRDHKKIDKKEDALNDYMFSIVIENGIYPKYYTEKIMDAFTTGTVPLYIGTQKISEDFDERGIIFLQKDSTTIDLSVLNRLSREMYESMLPYVQKNYEVACNMEMSDDIILRRIAEDD